MRSRRPSQGKFEERHVWNLGHALTAPARYVWYQDLPHNVPLRLDEDHPAARASAALSAEGRVDVRAQ